MSQVGGGKTSCCRNDLEGESGRVVRLECHDHHCRVEGDNWGNGDDDEYRLDAQIIGGDCFLPGEIVLEITASDLFLLETGSIVPILAR